MFNFFHLSAFVGLTIAAVLDVLPAQDKNFTSLEHSFAVIINPAGITLIDQSETQQSSSASDSTANSIMTDVPTVVRNGTVDASGPTKTSVASFTLNQTNYKGTHAIPFATLNEFDESAGTNPTALANFLEQAIQEEYDKIIGAKQEVANIKTMDEPSKTHSLQPDIDPSCVASYVACKDATTSAAATMTIPTPAFIIFGGVLVGASVAFTFL